MLLQLFSVISNIRHFPSMLALFSERLAALVHSLMWILQMWNSLVLFRCSSFLLPDEMSYKSDKYFPCSAFIRFLDFKFLMCCETTLLSIEEGYL